MTFLSDEVLDQGLDYATTNGTRVYLCSQEPATYAEASSTYALGVITVTTSATTDGDASGRKVTIGTATGGSVTGTGTATHYALCDASSILVAAEALSASQAVTSGNSFSWTAATDITIADPA